MGQGMNAIKADNEAFATSVHAASVNQLAECCALNREL
jgi:hypothetical protein